MFVFCMRPAGRPREVGISEHDAIFGNAHLLWLFRLGKRREAAQMSWNVQKWHLSFQGGVRGLDFGDFFQIQQRCSIENASINSENAQEFPHVWLSDNVTHTRMYAYQRVIVNYIILNERRLFLSQILNTTDELPADWGYMLRWTQHFSKKNAFCIFYLNAFIIIHAFYKHCVRLLYMGWSGKIYRSVTKYCRYQISGRPAARRQKKKWCRTQKFLCTPLSLDDWWAKASTEASAWHNPELRTKVISLVRN